MKKAKSALVSVFDKEGLIPVIKKLDELGVIIYSTGGTEVFIRQQGINTIPVEELTSYPSIFGGRVKTLHPKIFGGILHRRHEEEDLKDVDNFKIPEIDILLVDLYPFEKTLACGANNQDIIENIDIGGVSLIRAAAKNFEDVLVVPSKDQYAEFLNIMEENKGLSSLEDRQIFAAKAFQITSHYDTAIFNFFNRTAEISAFKKSETKYNTLKYGENPHQKGMFFGDLNKVIEKLQGKELSYNNLLDLDSAVSIISEFRNQPPTFIIIKHNNACGIATRQSLKEAYINALSSDPVSAFGGVLISNTSVDVETAKEIVNIFCEILIAPHFDSESLEILKSKKNLILIRMLDVDHLPKKQFRSILNGVLEQEVDYITDDIEKIKCVTLKEPSKGELDDLIFASKACKHMKSNAIVIVKDNKLLASGIGQTSRVDALKQAIEKAHNFKLDINGAVMASDAFFPFPDCVEIAKESGIGAIIQPGGSIRDNLSIDFCNKNDMAMVFTGLRHFKH
ncbi:bifunctional phosphoribosylaminoimidazolecarboxamide formyltransferase/IMP cyclohydrolase [Ichthyobacterium seriolicida]|uniref:Bifunctional purine biosynthesis protein PurH n=1 Tax=Ichthyobacterium seriolicida TaxID=242600 RepID=A0A1J1DVY4_9FLAO|nr:bifunctional phosphoribosylaminoimidazolecarboxamide formyltransferase/IMP cyclohydrolase [Ichthyobacterium seriolicida]BAV94018.1 phosphoribosylaminoimidazolecarboxamide formyltransferase [Ichthyobacterium seriolicida]